MKLKMITLLISITLLTLAAWLYVDVEVSQYKHDPQPLVLPVSLAPGTIRTPEIKTDLDRTYDIVLDLEGPTIRGQQLNPALRPGPSTGSPGVNDATFVPNLIDISWELFDDDRLISHGNSVQGGWATWANTLEGTIGRFEGHRGRSYSLVLEIKRDASQLNVDHPKIIVQIPRGLWEDYGAGIFIRKLEAGVAATIGTVILCVFFVTRAGRAD
jgi:hypothetical protein